MGDLIRTDVADALEGALSVSNLDWVVKSGRTAPREVKKVTLLLRQASIDKLSVRQVQQTTFELFLLHPGKNPDTIDDLLEPLVEELLDLLDALPFPGLIWTHAERVIFTVSSEVEYHGYKVDLTVSHTKG
jgi:hypothetical protein